MNNLKQQTIKDIVSIEGITLHTGCRAKLVFKPAKNNTGFVFVRTDLPDTPQVRAIGTNVTKVERGTTIEENGAVIHTVEHVLASLISQDLDNVIIEMNMPEPPICDGSSLPFIQKLQEAGSVEQEEKRQFFELSTPQEIQNEHSSIRVEPSNHFKISCSVQYGQLEPQSYSLDITRKNFTEQLAKARTFCNYDELNYLTSKGLAKGGSLHNALIIYGETIFSHQKARYDDELVRHKMLDIVGDFALLGKYPRFHIIADKPGHPTNVTMVKKLLELQEKGTT